MSKHNHGWDQTKRQSYWANIQELYLSLSVGVTDSIWNTVQDELSQEICEVIFRGIGVQISMQVKETQ